MEQENQLHLNKTILESASKIFKTLSDPTRLSILYLLGKQELNVGTIAQLLGMEQSAVSHQLKTLRSARLVKARRAGKTMIYSQTDDHVYRIIDQVISHTKEDENQ
ncbi:ArsR/SmtB family transcription factor [Pisciglobus halotolerans]|uniref:DNA-binding transcriptional regulator, ArsR family n=1 Tax=Pisciglobus halotolerans TaxID=745365 RepID=A0A1I3BJT7_9LACT|nr:metalloregulator ArsR/SmtB family transcription factor [Pisciglobus halotolerans]SFH62575.1 DNA-binding transcriptional regulator, ArsR family [Pisciglobus halotolerans]